MKESQRTIARTVEYRGIGLFSGSPVSLTFRSAPPDTGVVFARVDIDGHPRVPARAQFIRPEPRRTVLANGAAVVETVEHLLAALACLSIDNILIEMDAAEVPGTDGSGEPFIRILQEAQVVEQNRPAQFFEVTEPIVIFEDRATLLALPSRSDYVLSYWLDYDHPQMSQHFSIAAKEDALLSEVAPARTFCLEEEAEALKKEGIGKGANYQNVLVVGKAGVIDNRLRFPDEFARHKILDIVGDLLLVGARIRGHVIGHRSGHAHNFQLAKKMVSEMAKRNREEEDLSSKYLDIRQIQEILPHRYPMLLVDRVIEMDGERRAVGIKNVTINEEFFQGHFPGQPIMPGVLQIEAMAQLAGVLLLRRLKGSSKLAVLLSIDKVKLRRPVVPGDQLRLEAEAVKVKSRTGQVNTRALVEGVVAAEAQIKFMLVDRDSYAKNPSEVVPETE